MCCVGVACVQSLSSRFLSDLGGDDGELSDEEDDDAPTRSLYPRTAVTATAITARINAAPLAERQARASKGKSNTAPIIASAIADDEGDEFDF